MAASGGVKPAGPGPAVDDVAPPKASGAAAPPIDGRPPQLASLDCSTRVVLSVLCSVVNAQPGRPQAAAAVTDAASLGGGSPEQEAEAKVLSARFLISLFTLDCFSWGTGKIFQYEVLRLAERLDWCYIVAALVMTTAEVFVEFFASGITPRIYSWVQRTNVVSSKQLVIFALKTYWLSNLFALLVYPWFGIAIYAGGMLSPGLVIALGLLRTVQYAFGNQVGDTSVEMARPHWLATFQGTNLAFPGCGCLPSLVRESTVPTLATYQTLLRFAVYLPLAMVYVLVGRNDIARWTMAGVLLIFNVIAPSLLLYRCSEVTAGIVEEPVEEEKPQKGSLLRLRDLQPSEFSWLFFMTIMRGLPPQSEEALQSVLLLELPRAATSGLVAVVTITILSVLIFMICRIPRTAEAQEGPKGGGAELAEDRLPQLQVRAQGSGSFAKRWVFPVALILVLLTGGTAGILAGGIVALYLAVAVFVPIGPIGKILAVEIDKFLLQYDSRRSSSLVFWQGVLQVFVNAPLLAANWLAVEAAGCDDDEEAEVKAAGIVLFIAVGGLAVLVVYYSLIDWQLPKKASLAALVNGAVAPAPRPG